MPTKRRIRRAPAGGVAGVISGHCLQGAYGDHLNDRFIRRLKGVRSSGRPVSDRGMGLRCAIKRSHDTIGMCTTAGAAAGSANDKQLQGAAMVAKRRDEAGTRHRPLPNGFEPLKDEP